MSEEAENKPARSRSKSPSPRHVSSSDSPKRSRSRSPHEQLGTESAAIAATDANTAATAQLNTPDPEIVAKLNEREVARAAHNWPEADRIRDELKSKGVQIFDKSNSWAAADGHRWPIVDKTETEGKVPEASWQEINDLIQAREAARVGKNYAESDKLRDDLRGRGVNIFDKEKVWKSAGGMYGVIPYGDNTGVNDQGIHYLLKEREIARKSKDWEKGDRIRDLLRDHGVQVFDKTQTWRASDGRQGYISASNNAMQPGYGGGYGGYGWGQNYGGSNAYGNMQALYGGQAQQWGYTGYAQPSSQHMAGRPFGAGSSQRSSQGASKWAGATEPEITALVNQREVARQARDYATADALREALKTMGVQVFDKEKRWTSSDGKSGTMSAYGAYGGGPGFR